MTISSKGLTPRESALINKYIQFYSALADGRRSPTTGAHQHFIEVCKGTAAPETPHEVAFVKFREQQIAEERKAAMERQQEYQQKLDEYNARQNSSLVELDEDRWW